MPPAALVCNRCDAPIQIADLDQGLAVRVDGELVCQQCVDSLPGEAQVKINQLRAMRGLSATTYAVNLAKHPALHLFSFTTAGNITVHRRTLRSDGAFAAPALPAASAPAAAAPAAPPPPAAAVPTSAAVPRRWPLVVAGLVLALGGGVGLIIHHGASPGGAPNGPPAPPLEAAPVKTRFDYAVDPLQAWIQARDDRDCPELVRQAITLEVHRHRSQQLDEAELAIKDGHPDDAAHVLSSPALPDDLAFRELRAREDELRKRSAEARSQALRKAEAPPAPRPLPAPQLAVTAPPAPARPVVAAAGSPPAPARATGEPGGAAAECLKFPGKDLVLEDSAQWKRVHNDLHLSVDAASVQRSLMLEGGSYQVWIQVLNRSHDSAIQAAIGGQHARPIEVKSGNRGLWMQLSNDGKAAFALPAGSCSLAFDASGRGLEFAQIMLYDAALPAPDQAERLHPRPPRWSATPPSEAVVASATLSWKPRFIQAAKEAQVHAQPLDGSVYLPPGWPGGIQGFWKAVKLGSRRHHAMTLDFHDSSSEKGGIALLLNPGRLDRKQLLVTTYDQGGKTVTLPPFQFDGTGEWQVFTIQAKGDLDGALIGSVLLEDEPGADFPPEDGFLLAKAATCINEVASAATLALRPPALVRDEHRQKNVLKLLEAIRRFRRSSVAKFIDPAKLRLLVGAALGVEWRAAAKGQLDVLLPGRLPANLTQELVFQDSWLDDLTRGQGGQPALLDPQALQVVMVASAGGEIRSGMTPGQAVEGFWKKRLEQLINNGYLPVAVLGPSLVDSDRHADADKLWGALEEFITRQLPGVPIIDLRGAMVGPAGELTPDGQDFAAAMLADGYGEFLYWLRRSGGAK